MRSGALTYAIMLIVLAGLGLMAQPARAAPPLSRMSPEGAQFPGPVPIGADGKFKDYVRIDEGCPLTLQGPGALRFYVRAHIAPGAAAPKSVQITLEGLTGTPTKKWTLATKRSKATLFGDDRPGGLTGGKKVTLEIRDGLHKLIVTGTSDRGLPVYALFYYDGPALEPVEERPPRPPIADLAPDTPVPIGKEGNYKDYVRIDRSWPDTLQGPGMLRFYVRAHVAPGETPPESVLVTLDGLTGYGTQRWPIAVTPSKTSGYGDGRSGGVTGGKKITLAIPFGRHEVTVRGTSNAGGPVYALFLYDGPPVEAEESVPVEIAQLPPTKRKKTPKKTKKPVWQLDGGFSLDVIYDDNICRYSDDTLGSFKSGERPEKFAIETYDDLILSPTIQFELARALLFKKRTRFRVRYRRWDYVRNSIKANQEINLRFRQTFRRYDYLEATYTYAPDSYIKELSDRPPFTSRSVPRVYQNFLITRNAFLLRYRYRHARWLSLLGDVGRTLRFYNRPFLENDLWEWNFGVRGDIRWGSFTTTLDYGYANVKARGYDEIGESLEDSDNDGDGSYEKDTFRIRFTYRPKKTPFEPNPGSDGFSRGVQTFGSWIDRGLVALRTWSFYLQHSYARQFYASQRPLYVDPLHVGRLDQQRQWQIAWYSRPLFRKASLELGGRFTVRRADSPAGVVGEDDPSEEKDYTGNRYWIAIDSPIW